MNCITHPPNKEEKRERKNTQKSRAMNIISTVKTLIFRAEMPEKTV